MNHQVNIIIAGADMGGLIASCALHETGIVEVPSNIYDLIFYSNEVKELFLIEAKFFSDSLNNSGTISDYEKMCIRDRLWPDL